MSRYRCVNCDAVITRDIKLVGIQCEHCGGTIFYKGRSSIKKVIHPR